MIVKNELKAMKGYRDPGYPTIEALEENPDWFHSVPKRWIGKKYTQAFLMASILTLTGCGGNNADSTVEEAPVVVTEQEPVLKNISGKSSDKNGEIAAEEDGIHGKNNIIDYLNGKSKGSTWSYYTFDDDRMDSAYQPPYQVTNTGAKEILLIEEEVSGTDMALEAGGGIASYGCVSVARAYYLTEAEALQVVQDEFDDYGVVFDQTEHKIQTMMPFFEGNRGKFFLLDRPLELDGYSDEAKIGFEFIAEWDVLKRSKPSSINENGDIIEQELSSVESWNMKYYTSILAKTTDGDTEGALVGYFYEPQSWNEDKEISKKLLREQVYEFIKWLEGQGAI